MSVLLSLKEWVTLEEAAQHMSNVFSERVSLADIYRFALSGHLTLSANFVNHAKARLGRKMAIREAGFELVDPILSERDEKNAVVLAITHDALPELEAWLEKNHKDKKISAPEFRGKYFLLDGEQISATECVRLDVEISSIDGVWDLAMFGAERLDIEQALQLEISGPKVNLVFLDGAYVVNEDGIFACIQERFPENDHLSASKATKKWNDPANYYPAGELPSDSSLVVRTKHLLRFIDSTAGGVGETDAIIEKPLEERERASLLCIIRALDVMAKLPPRGAATSIEAQLQKLGFSKPSEATIRKVIEQARALEPNKPQ